MTLVLDLVSAAMVLAGCVFFAAGTAGLLRFPDVFTRMHALSKADNLGLGLVAVGLLLRAEYFTDAMKLLLIWLLAMLSASTTCYLIARRMLESGEQPWRR